MREGSLSVPSGRQMQPAHLCFCVERIHSFPADVVNNAERGWAGAISLGTSAPPPPQGGSGLPVSVQSCQLPARRGCRQDDKPELDLTPHKAFWESCSQRSPGALQRTHPRTIKGQLSVRNVGKNQNLFSPHLVNTEK